MTMTEPAFSRWLIGAGEMPAPSPATPSWPNSAFQAALAPSTEARPFLDWCYEFLPHHFYGDPAPFHAELAALFAQHDRLAIAAPRGHNKSTLVSLGYTLYRAALKQAQFILVVSDTATQAQDHIGNVQKELLENQKLLSAYPHLRLPEANEYREKKVRRRATDFITTGGVRFAAKGAGGGLRGLREGAQRPDLIVVDDLENDKNVETPRQREKLKSWFLKSLSNLFGAAGGQLLVIGTILHRESLLAWLLSEKAPAVYVKRRYQALTDGAALWPAAWNLDKLSAKRNEIGSRAFATEYLNDPADDDATLFKEDWIRRTRKASVPPGVTLKRIIVAVDPSSSEDGSGDACGIIVTGLGDDGRVYVLDDATMNGSPAAWGRRVLDVYRQWGANQVIAEKNQGGGMVTQTLKAELRPGEPLPPLRLVHAKHGKALRAEPVSVRYERDEVSHVGTYTALEDEMTGWTPGLPSPNRLDALVYGVDALSNPEPTAQFRMFAV